LNSADLPRRVLVVGSGGREHALVRALAASPARPAVLCSPGNAGIERDAVCFPVRADDLDGLVSLARAHAVAFAVIGPEVPLALGLADRLREAGIPVFGPGAAGARLEASKIATKRLLLKYGIPTAEAGLFSETAPALAYLRSRGAPIVVKADGLASGKGVVVAGTLEEAEKAVRNALEEGRFGDGGRQILIEDCLEGEETSVLVIVSGRDYVILPVAQDHKRVGDGDTGPNTGGMGAYAPAEIVTPELLSVIERRIVRPSVEAIAAEGIDFRGTLFIGLMLTKEGPSVLEFNTRFGDPETQVVLPCLASDLLDLLWKCATGRLRDYPLRLRPGHALCVVVCAQGYPDRFATREPIGLPADLDPGVVIYHAGTARDEQGCLVSAGGRVLGVTAFGLTLAGAAGLAYDACEAIDFRSKYYRRDIGARQLRRQ
jgi:phosphoribosylamine--glycine ligase